MARRKVQPADDLPQYDDVEPTITEETEPEAVSDIVDAVEEATAPLIPVFGFPDPVYTPDPTETTQRVAFTLPRSVLAALLDPTHSIASVAGAEHYGLLKDGKLTPIGEIVAQSFDVIALRHRMLAAWREQHNREVGGV